ncbi:hypothetical protein DJ526_07355, partial [Sulfolobus sp. A20-N-G8]
MTEIEEDKILEIIKGSNKDGVTISVIYGKLGISVRAKADEGKREEVKKLLDDLIKKGAIKEKTKGKTKRYYFVKEVREEREEALEKGLESIIKKVVQEALEKGLESIIKKALLEIL